MSTRLNTEARKRIEKISQVFLDSGFDSDSSKALAHAYYKALSDKVNRKRSQAEATDGPDTSTDASDDSTDSASE